MSFFENISKSVTDAVSSFDITGHIKSFLDQHKDLPLAENLKNAAPEEVDGLLRQHATEQFDQHVAPTLKEKNVPDALVQPARDSAIDYLIKLGREKYEQFTAHKAAN